MKRTTKSPRKSTAKKKATKKIARKKVTKRKRNPELKAGKHVLVPKFESLRGPCLIEISHVEDTNMGKQIVDKLGRRYLVDEYNIQGPYNDVTGLMSPERAFKVWRDIYYTNYPHLKK